MCFGEFPFEQANATQTHANNVAKRAFQKSYLDYWNASATLSDTGRPVEAIVIPVSPFAAAREKKYKFYGYSAIFNVLDYTFWYMLMIACSQSRSYKVAKRELLQHHVYDLESFDSFWLSTRSAILNRS